MNIEIEHEIGQESESTPVIRLELAEILTGTLKNGEKLEVSVRIWEWVAVDKKFAITGFRIGMVGGYTPELFEDFDSAVKRWREVKKTGLGVDGDTYAELIAVDRMIGHEVVGRVLESVSVERED